MINYNYISNAIGFYKKHGYKLIEVPWLVEKKYIDLTIPAGHFPHEVYLETKDKVAQYRHCLVGSAEQSFLKLIIEDKLEPGKYMAATPCFRDDPFHNETKDSEIHQEYFMKLELCTVDVDSNPYTVSDEAARFLNQFFSKRVISNPTGPAYQGEAAMSLDLLSPEGIELGSYLYKSIDCKSVVFGTGVAEPRLSQAKAFHLATLASNKDKESKQARFSFAGPGCWEF